MSPLRFFRFLPVVVIGFAGPSSFAQYEQGQAAPKPNEAVMKEHAAEFKVLDKDIARLDALLDAYTEPTQKITIFGYRNLMKARCDALTAAWDQVKYDELRYDINLQCQRLANYLAPLRTPPPAAPTEAVAELAVAKLNPSPTNPADVKAALEAVDREVKRLEERASKQTIGSAARDAETARIKRIKDQRAALSKEFTKAGWSALVADLK